MLPCHSPNPHMPECQPNLCTPSFPIFSGLLFSCSITPQPPFTCHPLSHPFPRPSHPSSYQIQPPFRAQFVPQFAPPEILQKKGEKNPGFHTYFALIACIFLPAFIIIITTTTVVSPLSLPLSHRHHFIHSPALLFADAVAQFALPGSQVWGASLAPANAAWETRSSASFRCHYWNATRLDRQTRAHTRTHQRERKLPEHNLPSFFIIGRRRQLTH